MVSHVINLFRRNLLRNNTICDDQQHLIGNKENTTGTNQGMLIRLYNMTCNYCILQYNQHYTRLTTSYHVQTEDNMC